MTSSFVGFFIVPNPLEALKSAPGDVFGRTDSIESF